LSDPIIRHPIQHIGYIVEDVPTAVERWVAFFGAGPFFWLGKHIEFERTTHYGQSCVLDHSAAIGKWGNTFVELAQVHDISPPELEQAFVGTASGFNHPNHISYAVLDPESEGVRLEGLGLKRFWHASRGPLEISYYDGRETIGHAIEVHRLSDAFSGLFETIDAAGRNWNGEVPLRDLPH
jgi:hypothetical protein